MFGCQNTGSAPGLDSLSHDGLTARQSEHGLVVDPLAIPAASPSERRRVRVSQRSTTHSLQPPASTSTVEPRLLPPATPPAAPDARDARVESSRRAAPHQQQHLHQQQHHQQQQQQQREAPILRLPETAWRWPRVVAPVPAPHISASRGRFRRAVERQELGHSFVDKQVEQNFGEQAPPAARRDESGPIPLFRTATASRRSPTGGLGAAAPVRAASGARAPAYNLPTWQLRWRFHTHTHTHTRSPVFGPC